ncbi:5'-3' exonuclease [Coprothermobacteraceae bacterium]|nr:5'-3' exonuclease [Coprothermobacteraceae bacterium]
MKRAVLVDSNSVLYRAYHALPKLTTSDRRPTGALYGFLRILTKLLREPHSHFVVVGDGGGPLVKTQIYAEYKAQRPKAPDDLKVQRSLLPEVLRNLGVPYVARENIEADDLIASLARAFSSWDFQVHVFTSDTDMLQLLDKNTSVSLLKRGLSEVVTYDWESFARDFGFTPDRYVDFKSLVGDTADNIPGVAGIGTVRAKELVQAFTREELTAKFGNTFDRNVRLIELQSMEVGYDFLLARVSPAQTTELLEDLEFESLIHVAGELLRPVEAEPGLFGVGHLDRLPWKLVPEGTRVEEPFAFAFTAGSDPLDSSHRLYASSIGVSMVPKRVLVNGQPMDLEESLVFALVNAARRIDHKGDSVWVEL